MPRINSSIKRIDNQIERGHVFLSLSVSIMSIPDLLYNVVPRVKKKPQRKHAAVGENTYGKYPEVATIFKQTQSIYVYRERAHST